MATIRIHQNALWYPCITVGPLYILRERTALDKISWPKLSKALQLKNPALQEQKKRPTRPYMTQSKL